ncbi:spore germination protein GerPE [Paenibacillus sp.]|uniref:spore germination protein GerPE n=1 Tax=Paenibacillus sp. TaxID=58172 RepID=UPI002D3FB56D|nr:spore germination protein GerPE [Paenibacillus sp.]HZG57118.1 spore germination protein GerPE [Paenibacillus sp.]
MRRAARSSIVAEVYVNSVSSSSIVLIGDGRRIDARSRAIAVKREIPVYLGDEGDFGHYPLFGAAIPAPPELPAPADAAVRQEGAIRVGRLTVLAVSSASVLQLGSTGDVKGEARAKQFRQVLPETAAAQGWTGPAAHRIPPA